MSSQGIDYGLGRTNIDRATGIRYGVISMHAITQAWADSSEAQYGDPHCPKCGQPAKDITQHGAAYLEQTEEYDSLPGCTDYACDSCRITFDSSDAYPEEAIGYTLDSDGYRAEDCLDSDVIVTKSEYYTYGPYCSPCVPGAVSLPDDHDRDPDTWTADTGIKAYCFSHDWFEEGKAPYRVYRVSDDTEVLPEEEG